MPAPRGGLSAHPGAVAAVALALMGSACTRLGLGPPHDTLLLVTLEGLDGGDLGRVPSRSPPLDALTPEGLWFDAAVTPSPVLPAALASTLTGVEPASHGLRTAGGAWLGAPRTIAERLNDVGWRTTAVVVDRGLVEATGLELGFTEVIGEVRPEEVAARVLTLPTGPARFVWAHLGGADPDVVAEQASHLVGAWLDAHPTGLAILAGLAGPGGAVAPSLTLGDPSIHVPLGVFGGEKHHVPTPASLIDVAPTLAAAAGLGAFPSDGVDLRAGGSPQPHSETLAPCALGLAPLHAWTDTDGRWISGTWGGWYPRERDGIAPEPVHGQTHVVPPRPAAGAPEVALDPAAVARWTQAGEWPADPNWCRPGIDPRDATEDLAAATLALHHASAGLFRSAATPLDDIARHHPEAPGPSWLAAALRSVQRHRPDPHLSTDTEAAGLSEIVSGAEVAEDLGAWDEAVRAFEAAARRTTDPHWADRATLAAAEGGALVDLGAAADEAARRGAGAVSDALLARLALLQGSPREAASWAVHVDRWNLDLAARAAWELGETEAAVAAWMAALEHAPASRPLRQRLASALIELERPADALRILAPTRTDPPCPPCEGLVRRALAEIPPEPR